MRRRAPAVYEWLARTWNARAARRGREPRWTWPAAPCWQPLWRRVAREYLPYLRQNALVFRAGARRFDFVGERLRFPRTVTTDYRVWCREILQRRYEALGTEERGRVDALFAPAGGLAALTAEGTIPSGMDERYGLPRPPLAAKQRRGPLKIAVLGQPRT